MGPVPEDKRQVILIAFPSTVTNKRCIRNTFHIFFLSQKPAKVRTRHPASCFMRWLQARLARNGSGVLAVLMSHHHFMSPAQLRPVLHPPLPFPRSALSPLPSLPAKLSSSPPPLHRFLSAPNAVADPSQPFWEPSL